METQLFLVTAIDRTKKKTNRHSRETEDENNLRLLERRLPPEIQIVRYSQFFKLVKADFVCFRAIDSLLRHWLVRWATGERLTDLQPKLSLITSGCQYLRILA